MKDVFSGYFERVTSLVVAVTVLAGVKHQVRLLRFIPVSNVLNGASKRKQKVEVCSLQGRVKAATLTRP